MLITHKKEIKDPPHPIMAGKSPIAKEFNKRQEKMWKDGVTKPFDYEQVSTVLLEILCDDYDRRHASRKRKPKPQKGIKKSK